jgi:hypothetical protein
VLCHCTRVYNDVVELYLHIFLNSVGIPRDRNASTIFIVVFLFLFSVLQFHANLVRNSRVACVVAAESIAKTTSRIRRRLAVYKQPLFSSAEKLKSLHCCN